MIRPFRLAAVFTALALAAQLAAPALRAATPAATAAPSPPVPDPRHAAVWRCLERRFPTAELRPIAASELERTLARLRAAGHRVIEFPAIPLDAVPTDATGDDCARIQLATNQTPPGAGGEPATEEEPEAGDSENAPAQLMEAPGPADEEEATANGQEEAPAEGEQETQAPASPGQELGGPGDDSLEVALRLTGDVGRGCDEGCAPLLFVVLGALVIWFVVVAAVDIGVNLVAGGEVPPIVFGAGLHYGFVHEDEATAEDVRDIADLRGLRAYAAGRSRSNTEVGLAGEYGRLRGKFGLEAPGEEQRVDGDYWLVGPMVMFGARPGSATRLFLDLLAGSSDDPAVDSMAVARIGFHLGFGRLPLYAGGALGALYLSLDEDAGLARDEGEFNFLYSIVAGAQF